MSNNKEGYDPTNKDLFNDDDSMSSDIIIQHLFIDHNDYQSDNTTILNDKLENMPDDSTIDSDSNSYDTFIQQCDNNYMHSTNLENQEEDISISTTPHDNDYINLNKEVTMPDENYKCVMTDKDN